jgi:predicted esterase
MPVFMAAGRRDTMIAPDNTERLAAILQEAGADLDLRWKNVGHPLTYQEIEEATAWLSGVVPVLKS